MATPTSLSGSVTTSTTTVTIPGTVTTSTTTVTLTGSTVTVAATAGSTSVAVDQSGCPAVDGANVGGYIIHCGYAPISANAIMYLSGPGYNIEDCLSQCSLDPNSQDCLATSYVAPNSAFNELGQLLPGTCNFYDFVSGTVATPGTDTAIFDNLGFTV